MKMEISPFPVFPFPFGKAASYSLIFSRTYVLSLSQDIVGDIHQGSKRPCIPRCLWSSTSSCIVQSCRPSVIWLLGTTLCVGVCFSCFLTCILFSGVGISLSRWSPSQDILQSICEPETTGDFFFFDSRRSLIYSILPDLLVNLKKCSLCKTTL